MRRHSARPHLRRLLLTMLVATMGEHTAHAQSTGFALNRFDAAPAGSDWFTLDSLDMRGSLRPAFQLLGDFAYRPLVLYNANGSVNTAVVGDQLFAELGGSLVLADRVRLSLTLPVAAYQHGNSVTFDNVAYNGPNAAAIGDLRLDGDVRLFGTYGDAFTLAIGSQFFLPTGNRSLYAGDGSVRLAPHVLAAGQIGIFTYAASLGLVYHAESASYAGTPVGGELTAAASAGLLLADKHLLIGPEVWGRTDITDGTAFTKTSSPVEGTMGVHGLTTGGWRFGAGLGTGLAQGLGTPELRALASISYSPPPAVKKSDRDGDGILDENDACPDTPGIHTEDPHTNGCPEEAPPPAPPPPPPPVGPADRDHDGVLDGDDACPDVPGEANVDPARNGCPKAVVFRDTIRILDQVKFRTDSAEILAESDSILDAVRKALEEHPNIQKVDIEGHTDSRGNAAHNQALSEARARSVKAWLIGHGIDATRLTSHGLGATRPIDSNETQQGRQNNRRVEFHILSTAKSTEEAPSSTAPVRGGEREQEKRVVAALPLPEAHPAAPSVESEPAAHAATKGDGETHVHAGHSKPEKTKIDFDANASALGVVDTNMFDKGTGSVQAVGFDVAGALTLGVPVTRRVSWVSGGGLGTNYRDGVSGSVSSADAMRVDANVRTGIEALLAGKSSLPGRKVKKATYPSVRLNLEAKYALWANPLITQPPAASDESVDALEPDDDSDSGGGGDTGGGDTGSRKRPIQLAQADSSSGTDAAPAGGDDDTSDAGDEPQEDPSSASSGAGPQTFSNPNTHNKVTGPARVTVDTSKRLALVTETTFGRDFVQLDDSVEVSPNYDEIIATETAKYQLVPKKLTLSVGYVFERRFFDDVTSTGASQDFYVQGAKASLDIPLKRVKLKVGYDIRAKLADAGSAKNTTRNQIQLTAELPIVKHLSAVGEGRFTYTLFDTAPSSARFITLVGLKVKL